VRTSVGPRNAQTEAGRVSSSDEDALRFIAASFPSVWALELLLAIKSDRRPFSRDELVAVLRASDLVVSKAIDALVAAGLVSVERGGVVYMPVNGEVEAIVNRVEQLYRTRPNSVRRAIVSAGTSSAAAFADAFKLRRDRDD
jgi:predicted transcriptional regulator